MQTNTVYEEKAPYSNTIKLVMVCGLFSLAFLSSFLESLNRLNSLCVWQYQS